MADEAFALSPISARAELPSERDYDAIREAFMETARGRWFLGEFGKRNRNADTTMVLDAVARLEATVSAQKQAPGNELPDALVLIRGLLSDAKDRAARTMSGPDAELALAAVNKATRIIREIAWTLREYGTDTRICDMLDAQVNAIETSHQHTIATEKRDAVLATFDLLIRRIGELGGTAGAPSWSDSVRSPAKRSHDGDETDIIGAESAAPASFKTASETTADATYEVAAKPNAFDTSAEAPAGQAATADHAVVQDPPTETVPTQSTLAQGTIEITIRDGLAQDVSNCDALTTDARAQDALAPDALVQDALVHDAEARDIVAREAAAAIPPASEGSFAALTDAAAEITSAASTEQEVVAAANAEAAALDLEIAQDMAVLDAIAAEMAEPDFPRNELTGQEEPSSVGSSLADPVATGPVIIEAGAVMLASDIAVSPEPEQPSLGETLIASGIFSTRSTATDALAPIRRMTQAERIAFFS